MHIGDSSQGSAAARDRDPVVAARDRDPVLAATDRDLAFRFLGGRCCLDFSATVGERWRREIERLRAPADLGRWFVDAGLLSEAPTVTATQLRSARELRECVHRSASAAIAGEPFEAADVACMNAHALRPPPAPRLVRGAAAWVSRHPTSAALSLIARDAIDLLGGPLAARIRECESAECALLFLDTSRPGHRRWCSSATCGSRARSAAYRGRRGSRAPL